MQIKPLHTGFIMPTKGTAQSGAIDLYMPEDGIASRVSQLFGLGFAAAVPPGHVALLVPRSSTGAKHGLELNNTCGVIDEDYRGEWKAALRTKSGLPFRWKAGERVIQALIVPVTSVQLEQVDELPASDRQGGFGSTGK